MAYTVNQLVSDAWYTTGIVSRQLQTVSGQQLSDGINLLNDILGVKTADDRLIPYYKQLIIDSVINQEGYFVPNLIGIETFVFNIGVVRYAMQQAGRKIYFGTSRIDNIDSLPFTYHMERGLGGATIYVYFLPAEAYALTIWGKFGLDSVVQGQDLELTYDRFYIVYLRYALAQFMCQYNSIQMPMDKEKQLMEYENLLVDQSPMDLSTTKMSSLQTISGINWGDINQGRGWRPS